MVKTRKVNIRLAILTAVILLLVGACKNDPPIQTTTYSMVIKDVLGISGSVTFTEMNSNSVIIEIDLVNAPTGSHPAYLCKNSAVEDGAIVTVLNPIDVTGKSSTIVTTLTYNQLIAYDGFIKVLTREEKPNDILAQGDIGGNLLTAVSQTYALNKKGVFGVSGTVLFEERLNGNTLVTIALSGTLTDEVYPATINLGSVASVGGGPVIKALINVDGSTGESHTNIRKLDSGIEITYENWLVYDGYINIYRTPMNLDNIICQGDIGSNLTSN